MKHFQTSLFKIWPQLNTFDLSLVNISAVQAALPSLSETDKCYATITMNGPVVFIWKEMLQSFLLRQKTDLY